MNDDDELEPEVVDDELDEDLDLGKTKKPKKDLADDDLVSDDSESLDSLADAELGDDEDSFDDKENW